MFILFLLLAPATGIGGGDTKLMMAVGALMGIRFVAEAMLFSAIIGGIFALMVMARHKILVSTTRSMITNLYLKLILRAPVQLTDGSSGIKFRYGLAIALGSFLALVLKI